MTQPNNTNTKQPYTPIPRSKIIHNRAMCLLCKDVIESLSVHDFVQCACGNIHVDGGKEYLKRGAIDFDGFMELSEFES